MSTLLSLFCLIFQTAVSWAETQGENLNTHKVFQISQSCRWVTSYDDF